jgi:hypothetical protein
MPELKVDLLKGSKSSLDDILGKKLVFELTDRRKNRRKFREDSVNSQPKSLNIEAQVDMIGGKPHLNVESDDMDDLMSSLDTNGDGDISKSELKGVKLSITSNGLIENHSRDADVTKYMSSEDVFFEYTPETVLFGMPGPGTLTFNTDIVKIGLDDEGNVISFICPQKKLEVDNTFVSGSLLSEVEVGEVGGKIDPLTGKGVIYGDDLAWKFWGDVEVFGKTISIAKKDAAFIPVEDASGSGGLLALDSIERSAHGGGNIDNVFSSYFVQGKQGDPSGIQKGSLQKTLIQAVNLYLPGFANGGTDIQWNIDLQKPVTVVGNEYVENAHSLEMHSH